MSILLTCSLLIEDTPGVLRCWIIKSISESNSAIFPVSAMQIVVKSWKFVSKIYHGKWELYGDYLTGRIVKDATKLRINYHCLNAEPIVTGTIPCIYRARRRMVYNAKKHESTSDIPESDYLLTHRSISVSSPRIMSSASKIKALCSFSRRLLYPLWPHRLLLKWE